MKKYTIEQIQEYLASHLPASLDNTSGSLHNAILMINDNQDGIEAVTQRTQGTPCYEAWRQHINQQA